MARVMVISPGVLPLPPVLGGAVENMIARLHPGVCERYKLEYIAVRSPVPWVSGQGKLAGATLHYIDSIDPLADFSAENQFELHGSAQWENYQEFCCRVAQDRGPQLIHIHNEAHLLAPLREALATARLLLHVNDEVVTRMHPTELARLAGACDRILACSNYIADQMSAAFGAAALTAPPIGTFYNFADTGEYDPLTITSARLADLRRQLDLGTGPVVMFVGRIIEQKGPHLALRAFARIAAAHPAARLVFVGAPWYSRRHESPFVEAVRREASGVCDRIRFTGYVDHDEMPAYYALADIVCVPSIWDDPSPFVAYEAQAMARPVLGSNRGGIPEIVADYDTGRCIDPFNVPLFAQVLDDWLGSPELRREIGTRGRERVCARFDVAHARRQMRAVYDRLCPGA